MALQQVHLLLEPEASLTQTIDPDPPVPGLLSLARIYPFFRVDGSDWELFTLTLLPSLTCSDDVK